MPRSVRGVVFVDEVLRWQPGCAVASSSDIHVDEELVGFFWLWNPTLTDLGVEFEITPSNMIDPGQLTEGDVHRCLGVAGLRGVARHWDIRETRSAFFTSYADSDDWRDRWSRAWHVKVEGDFDPARPGELPVSLTDLQDLDQTVSAAGEEDEEALPTLLVVGGLHEDDEVFERLVHDTFTSASGRLELTPLPGRTIMPRRQKFATERGTPEKTLPLHLVRALAFGTRFPAHVERLERGLRALEAKGLFTGYQAYDFLATPRTFEPSRSS
jgi:hypothetical protein